MAGAVIVASPVSAQEAAPAVVPAFATAEIPAADVVPEPPKGSSPGQILPALGTDGRFVTPNRDLSREETVWHMRVALNVAALGCRAAEQRIVAGYNAMLAARKAELVAAQAGVDQAYRARFAAAWQARSDDSMTKLYNFFAQPPAQADFCVAAEQILGEVATVAPSAFADFAEGALPRLEAPFLAFYARYARYQIDLADWRARTASRVTMASAGDAPAAPPQVQAATPVIVAAVATATVAPAPAIVQAAAPAASSPALVPASVPAFAPAQSVGSTTAAAPVVPTAEVSPRFIGPAGP